MSRRVGAPRRASGEPSLAERSLELWSRAELERHPQYTAGIAHAFDLLRCFSPADPLLGNKDLAERLGFSKPTISRLTFTLVGLGFLRREPRTGKYELGPAVLSLGYPLLASMRLRHAAVAEMYELCEHAGHPVSLGTRDRLQVVYVETIAGPRWNATKPDIGSTRPIHQTAIGRALLHAYRPSDRELLIERLAREYPEPWARHEASVRRSLAELDAKGYCIVWSEWRPDLCAVGVPLPMGPGHEPFALNLTIPTYETDRERLETEHASRVVGAARNVLHRLGLSEA